MKFWIYLAAIGLLSGGLFYIKHRMDEATRLEIQNGILKTQNKEKSDEADAFASKPKSLDDVVISLCAWRKYITQNDSKAKRSLPRRCH